MMNSESPSNTPSSYQTGGAASASSHHPSSSHAQVPQHHLQQQQQQYAVHPSSAMQQMQMQQQQQQTMFMPTQLGSTSSGGNRTMNGGLLYNNLIPGHYRYGVKPPAPPPGPLSYSNTSQSTSQHVRHQQQQQQSLQSMKSSQPSSQQQPVNGIATYHNVVPRTSTSQHMSQSSAGLQGGFDIVQVSEPDEEDDDDLLVVAADEVEEDDEQYYRPFRHHAVGNGNGNNHAMGRNGANMNQKSTKKASQKNGKGINAQIIEKTKPVDLLAVLLGGPAQQQHGNTKNAADTDNQEVGDIASLTAEAASKSQKARSMTNALASKKSKGGTSNSNSSLEGDNDYFLYAATSNAHADAALSFQQAYRSLLGIESKGTTTGPSHPLIRGGSILSPSEELAKSMLILANMHARMAKSLGVMGVKWNMGKLDSGGRMMLLSKDGTTSNNADNSTMSNNNGVVASKDGKKGNTQAGKNATSTPSSKNASSSNNAFNDTSPDTLQHERLRMAVRGALDTGNHEEDITNSTFLARSTVLNANKKMTTHKKSPVRSKNLLAGRGIGRGNNLEGKGDGGVNPVDDLMKLEKELRCMDMALEMGSSVANLGANGAASSSRGPDGSFMVVPPGSSYMSSSSMWTSGILGGGGNGQQHQKQQQQHVKQHQQQQGGMTSVRSRNHLQNFIGGGNKPQQPAQHQSPTRATAAAAAAPPASPQQLQQGLQITPPNAALDQSWWGGGHGSILASSAISTAAASSNQRPTPNSGSNSPNSNADARQTSTNAKQLMQLMDSLNRLGNENAQLMREVEDAKAARAEAKASKDMMAKFKNEYTQRFNKVKEALKKYPGQQGNSDGGADNPVVNSAYVKSASMLEIQKRDQMIKELSTDLKKERDEVKKKDSALQKYEAFYREVKARSAEKARQRQLQEQQQKQKKLPQQQQRS